MPRSGGKRRKTRTHKDQGPENAVVLNKTNQPITKDNEFIPQSIVARSGKVIGAVKELTRDIRRLMEPHTASNLKERRFNRIKDYVSVAGMLDVSHILTISQNENANVILKIARYSSGPTLYFKVNKYSLSSTIKSLQKHPYDSSRAFATPPIVVLNNFSQSNENHILAMKAMLQNMLPSINVKTIKLSDCRRVVLFHYKKEDESVELRHYAIRATPIGVNRSVKKVLQGSIPNLNHLEDVCDFIEGNAGGSVSDSEAEDEESHVTLSDRYNGKGNNVAQRSSIKLTELGPRMTLELFKVENGLGEGEVLYHKYVHKTESEAAALKLRIESEKQLKEERKRIQNDNVKRKREALEESKRMKLESRRLKLEGKSSQNDANSEENLEDDGYKGEDNEDYEDDEEDEEEDDDEDDYENSNSEADET